MLRSLRRILLSPLQVPQTEVQLHRGLATAPAFTKREITEATNYKNFQKLFPTPQLNVDHSPDERAIKNLPVRRNQNLTNAEVRAKRSELFSIEKARQVESVRRVEKIEVHHRGPPEDCTLIMNKNISTPFNCTMHVSEMLGSRSAIALVDGKPWDMHRPLENDCELQLLHFMLENPAEANSALWRTGSLMLSYVADRALKDDFFVEVHSWPYQDIHSGSFLCDVDLKVPDWTPKEDELRAMTLMISRLIQRKIPLERLEISVELALKMFEANRFKKEQIPLIAEKSPTKDRIIVYRLDDHVEISSGPMVSNTSHFGRHQITAIHPIDCHGIGRLYRLQGIALPAQQHLNYFAWNIIVNRARQFNCSPTPAKVTVETEDM